jgi:hypothetical protein
MTSRALVPAVLGTLFPLLYQIGMPWFTMRRVLLMSINLHQIVGIKGRGSREYSKAMGRAWDVLIWLLLLNYRALSHSDLKEVKHCKCICTPWHFNV